MSNHLPPVRDARPENDRIERLIQRLQSRSGARRADIKVVRAPLRVSPLGAHIDHQLGCVMGMAIDRSILLAFAPTNEGGVEVESLDFATPTRFQVESVPPYQKGDWGNYLRGAVLALRREHAITRGIVGVMDSDMPIGGLSSSAAVTIAYLLALEDANGLTISAEENIRLVTRTEHDYIGLNNGILDQTSILFSRRNHLTHIDCRSVRIERIPTSASPDLFALMAVYSGVDQALVGTSYNNRVAECQAAAHRLLAAAGQSNGALPRLREVPAEYFTLYGRELEEPLRRRATHFFSEMARVTEGETAWRSGDVVRFGALMTASGASSIDNYECGCPQLITLYQILCATPGVYGVRFSGAGFRGNCLALIDPNHQEAIASHLHRHYPVAHPEMADRYSIHFCQPADGAELLCKV